MVHESSISMTRLASEARIKSRDRQGDETPGALPLVSGGVLLPWALLGTLPGRMGVGKHAERQSTLPATASTS